MSSQLVHIGDFHAAPGPRNEDRYRALDQIIEKGRALPHLGAWLWPGDLFDVLSTPADRNALDARVRSMASVAPVVICYGNHDRAGDLDGFANLQAAWPITVVDRPGCVTIRLATRQNATIFVLPYPFKAGLVGAGVAAGDVVSTAADLLEPIFLNAATQLAAARARGELTLMIGHVNVAGSMTSTGQPNIGHEIELHPQHLDRLGPIYKGLNHVHKPQEIAGAHYAGSVARNDYGEIEEKRFLIIELDDDQYAEPMVISRPLDVPPMFHVAGVLTSAGFSLAEDALTETIVRFEARDWAGCDVRVRYHYQASERGVISEDVIRGLFAGALRLKIEGHANSDRDLREPAVARAVTLTDKLAAYRKVEALPPSILAKLSLLESSERPDVHGAVLRQLQAIARGAEKGQVAA